MSTEADAVEEEVTEAELDALDDATFGPVPGAEPAKSAADDDFSDPFPS